MSNLSVSPELVSKFEAQREWPRARAWLIVGAAVALCVLAHPFVRATDAKSEREVRANRFVLVDEDGGVRGFWGFVPGNAVALNVRAQAQGDYIGFFIQPDGNPGLILTDRDGKARISMRLLPDGSPVLSLGAPNEEQRVQLSVKPDGAPELLFKDQNGKTIFTAP